MNVSPLKSTGFFCDLIRFFFLVFLSFSLYSCGGGREVPSWTVAGYNYLEGFKKSYMGGNEDHADLYFRRALEEIKKSGDLETLARAFLIRMALQRAVLSRVETEEFVKIAELSPNERNETYFYFLLGETDKVKPNLLPGYYITFFEALSKPDALQVVRSVGSIDDPLSRLVACGIAVEKGIVSEDLLKIAINTASHMGWKRALVSYMKFTVDFYEKRGKKEQAENVRARLKIIEK